MAMPSSLLWAVDIFGRVYTLSTVGQYWELCKDTQLEFKRVSAVKQCCWGIACDHQVYTYVFSGDVPIRYQEETYENQVWQEQCLSHSHCLDWQHILRQLSLCVFLTGGLISFIGFHFLPKVSEEYIYVPHTRLFLWYLHSQRSYTSLLLTKAVPVWTAACSVWAISDWSIHPVHWVASISPFLSDKYTIPIRKCPM